MDAETVVGGTDVSVGGGDAGGTAVDGIDVGSAGLEISALAGGSLAGGGGSVETAVPVGLEAGTAT